MKTRGDCEKVGELGRGQKDGAEDEGYKREWEKRVQKKKVRIGKVI